MKKIAPIFLLAGLATMTAASIVIGSLSWFSSRARIDDTKSPINATSEGAYFAYGNGSASKPFGINKPRHLYNLAWLNMHGYFEGKDIDGDGNSNDTFYFEIDPKLEGMLDGDGLIIPPIGTFEHPFYGNFNGNGKVITNFVITNNKNEFTTKPGAIDSIWSDPEIVGLFGVVGPVDTGTPGTSSPSYSYNTEALSVYNLGVSGITVKATTTNALIGIVAGYVNGELNDVAVDASTINISSGTTTALAYTTRLSDYGVVGFCTPNYKKSVKKVSETIYDVKTNNLEYTINASGDNNGWGGSIDMVSVHDRLNAIRAAYTTRENIYLGKINNYNSDNTLKNSENTNVFNYARTYNETNHGSSAYNPKIGAYQLGNTAANGSGSPDATSNSAWIHYLSGGHYTENRRTFSHTGVYIRSGSNYLTFSDNTFTNTTDSTLASLWTITSPSGVISTEYNGQTIYLKNNSGELSYTDSENDATTWSVSTSNSNMYITSGTYKLVFYNSSWTLMSSSGVPYYVFYNGSNYFGTVSGNRISTSTSANAAHWFLDGKGYYYLSGTTKYYLGRYYTYSYNSWYGDYDEGTNYAVTARTEANTTQEGFTFYQFDASNNYMYTIGDIINNYNLSQNVTIYVRYYGGWTSTNSARNRTSITRTTRYETVSDYDSYCVVDTLNSSQTREGPDYEKTSEGMDYSGQDVTYFPINVENNYEPKATNTGYVVGGSNMASVDDGYGYGTVRISRYSGITTYIGNYSSSTKKLSNVLTYNDSGTVTINDNNNSFEKYSTTKSAVETVFKNNSSYVYGLHFMQSSIDSNKLVTARYAKINRAEHTNYQLPASSIDFNLKEKGYINFMAGTYYSSSSGNTTVDSMFSLHQIIRNDNDDRIISQINEIEAVLSDGIEGHSYVYKLVGGGYTIPYSINSRNEKFVLDTTTPFVDTHATTQGTPSGYSVVFKTSWIKTHTYTQKRAYYFEIPMNMGEYCLGSVSDGQIGAYLMYLDIGSSAKRVNRTQFEEHFVRTIETGEIPKGVALVTPSTVTTTTVVNNVTVTTITINNFDTACVYISPGYTGNLSLTRNGNDITVGRTDTSSTSKAKPSYVSETVSLIHDSGGTAAIPIDSSTTTEDIKRLQYYELYSSGEVVRTVITDVTVGNNTTRTVEQYVIAADGTETAVQDDNVIVYSSAGKELDATEIAALTISPYTSDDKKVISFNYTYTNAQGINVTETIKLNVADLEEGEKYFTFTGYDITITVTGETIIIHITNRASGDSYVIKINGGSAITPSNYSTPITVNP